MVLDPGFRLSALANVEIVLYISRRENMKIDTGFLRWCSPGGTKADNFSLPNG